MQTILGANGVIARELSQQLLKYFSAPICFPPRRGGGLSGV
jgi:hypothetical protein